MIEKKVLTLRILLGVTGGIAAYKTPELVRLLRRQGHEVRVVLTQTASTLVAPAALQAVSGHAVAQSWADTENPDGMDHIALAKWADVILVAPATAHSIATLAHGLANDILSTLVLASPAKLFVAPAMNQQMWHHPATQANVQALKQRGADILGPGVGEQACGDVGPGRLLDLDDIVSAVIALPAERAQPLKDQQVLITAGSTLEAIDPVRFLSNHSTGRMGYALAETAAALGAEVTLISGPTELPKPMGVDYVSVTSAADMWSAVQVALPGQDIFISTAAVADYTPVKVATQKQTKADAQWDLQLERTTDILASVYALPERPFCIGFCAQTHDLAEHAARKLAAKADLLVANYVGDGRGFGDVDASVLLCGKAGEQISLSASNKTTLSQLLWQRIMPFYQKMINTTR